MKKDKLKEIDFYFITDSILTKKNIISDVKSSIKAGCKIIQYREKNKETRYLLEEAEKIHDLCENKALFIINDRIDIALATNSDGVHLGQDDMPLATARKLLGYEKIIGMTVHNIKEAIEAEKKGADYLGISPIFTTTTKKDAGIACGTKLIEDIRKIVHIPLVAIGGITKETIIQVIEAGADSAVAISAIVCKDDVFKEVKEIISIINKVKKTKNS